MENAVIVYGSVTGLTERVALSLGDHISSKYDTKIIDAMDFDPSHLDDADLVLLGSSTWGVGDLQIDMVPVHDSIKTMDLSSKRAAVFGVGDSAYKRFCRAVNTLEKTLQSAGAQIVQKGFRCDKCFDDEAQQKLQDWAQKL